MKQKTQNVTDEKQRRQLAVARKQQMQNNAYVNQRMLNVFSDSHSFRVLKKKSATG
jgi:hypothetical protein